MILVIAIALAVLGIDAEADFDGDGKADVFVVADGKLYRYEATGQAGGLEFIPEAISSAVTHLKTIVNSILHNPENQDAMNNLGLCYMNGTGVSEDEQEAVKWWRLENFSPEISLTLRPV